MKSLKNVLLLTLTLIVSLGLFTAASYADTEIPEGAPFTNVTTDFEGAEVTIEKTDRQASYNGGSSVLWKFTIPQDVKTVYFTVPRASVYFAPQYGTTLSGCTNKGNGMTSFLDAEYDDDTVTFHVDPLEWQDEDEYWAAVYTNSFQPYFAFTFKLVCDHPENDLTHYDGVEATCTEPGKHEVWYCDKCKKYFTDEGLTTRINEEDIDIPALGHAWEDGVCTRCGLRGTTTVEFIGEVPDRISDKSADTENSGLDYKFKVSKGVVSEVTIAEMVTSFNVDPAISIEQYASYFKFYKLDNTIYNGVSVPNYSLHIPGGNGANVIKKNDADYDLVQTDGTKGDKSKNSGRRFSTGEGQYYITKAGTDEPVIGLVWHNDEDEELSYGPMEAGEDGFYIIPAGKMIPDKTVTISVDKPAYEKVEDKIDAIGSDITLESEAAITEARAAYEALSDADKEKVSQAKLLKLQNAEQQLALLKSKDGTNDDLIDAQIAALKATQEAIDTLDAEINDLRQSQEVDQDKIAELEGQLAELQTAAAELAETAAVKAELEQIVEDLNGQITDLNSQITALQTDLEELSGGVSGTDALNNAKTVASKEVTKYLEDNFDKMYAADQSKAEIAALKAILKIKDAADQDEIDQLVADAKALIDKKVTFKTETEAKIAEAKAYKVTGLKATSKAKKFTVSWKKTTGAGSYQVQYRLSGKKWGDLKASVKAVKAKSKKLKKGKKYQFRVRTITVINGQKVYGAWSTSKAVKCK